jgi:hypothetical protein
MHTLLLAIVSALLATPLIASHPTTSQRPRDCSALITASHSSTYNWTSSTALSLARCLLTPIPETSTCLFYTSNALPLALRYAAHSKKTTIYNTYSPKYFNESISPMREWKAAGHQRDVFRITSKAYALSCSGRAEVVMPVDSEACPGSIWVTDEYEVIRNGESGIVLPVWRVGWLEEKGKWDVKELEQRSRRVKREADDESQVIVADEVGDVDEVTVSGWRMNPGSADEDWWAVRHGTCSRR